MTRETFGLTRTVGPVEGEAVRYTVTNGTVQPASDPMAALTTTELEAITLQATAEMDAHMQFAPRPTEK